MELADLIHAEMEENPVLEESALEGVPETAPAEQREDPLDRVDMDAYFQEYYESQFIPTSLPPEVREEAPLENIPETGTDLTEHLLWQLALNAVPLDLVEPIRHLIGNLDDDGYLTEPLGALAGEHDLATLERALAVLQTFDPPGVGARSLPECLLLQTDHPRLREALRRCWQRVLDRDEAALEAELACTAEEVREMMEALRHLDPHPGRKYTRERPIYVEPDVFVIRRGDAYLAQVNDDGLPKLRINRGYLAMYRDPGLRRDREAVHYIEKKLHSAFWLLRSVEQRRRTLQRVAQAIVDRQKAFLDDGPERLRPLLLRDISGDVGVHESTVSRVVANKYMQTPRGLFPMRSFFLAGLTSPTGEGYTLDRIKALIAQIVRGEAAGRPLSDSRIAHILEGQYRLKVARRTVAKYREELGIPASQERKQTR
jgi:RNA polymerase sigma-54 factor